MVLGGTEKEWGMNDKKCWLVLEERVFIEDKENESNSMLR